MRSGRYLGRLIGRAAYEGSLPGRTPGAKAGVQQPQTPGGLRRHRGPSRPWLPLQAQSHAGHRQEQATDRTLARRRRRNALSP